MKDIVKLILELADQQINIFLEDGKLKIDAPNGIVLDAVISKIKLHRDGIIEYLSGNKHNAVVEINAAPVAEDYPLSSSQRRLWVLSQFEEGSIAYNIPGVFKFEGTLDTAALSRSFETLIERHESLRTVFRETTDGQIKQYILAPATLGFEIGYHDLCNESEVVIKEDILNSLSRPFDLENGPLLRADLYQTGEDKWIFSYVMHHIISDGWSMEILIKELLQLYDIYVKGETNPLSPLRIHYKDYAVWQQQQSAFQPHKEYWLQQFSGELPVLEFPADKVRPGIKTYNGASLHKQMDAAITAGLKALCHSEGSTLFMVLLAGIKVLLYRYTGQEDIIIGSPIAGREHSDLEGQIGFYVNTLALRTQFTGTDSFQQLLARVKQVTLNAYEHQSYPFDALLEELDVQRDMSRSALFDVLLVLQHQSNTSLVEKGLTGLHVSTYEGMQQGSKFDLQFSFVEAGDQLEVHITYNTDIYYTNTIAQLACHLEQLFGAIIATPQKAIGTLEYLSLSEQTLLLETFNATSVSYALDKTVVDLFEEQVAHTPDQTGLLYEDVAFNYRQLNEVANQLANYLKQVYNISADDLIGVQLERNEWLIISLLGVLKSGGAYVPIDPRYPQDRIDFIIADSQCKVVLDEKELNKFRAGAAKYNCENPVQERKSADLAYVIYTSGSTGRPKGVMITHSNVYAFMEWCKEEFNGADYEVVLGVTSICFDLSIFEIFYTLVSGKKLRLLADALSIPQYLDSSEPLLLNTVPGVVSNLLSMGADLSHVRVLNMAGEPIPTHTISQLDCNRIAIRNLYGPSEDTTYSTVYRINSAESILIGHPISNTKIYILSDLHQLQPVGVAGEICISGAGLARGYLNQDGLTAEKFIANPFVTGERLYKTGDLGKWQPDGNILFLGRKDDQVKIRGHRIELGEISEVLHGYPEVTSAVVTVTKDGSGDNLLTAYVVGTRTLDAADLRRWLGLKLPHFMLPTHFIQLEALPLLPNGKLNRKALPAPHETGTEYVAPGNLLETQLVEIWKDILGKEQIGVKDNFFDLGGHSLKATRLASSLYKVLGVKVSLKELFMASTIEAQAIVVAQSQQGTYATLPAAPQLAYYPLSSSQHRLWTLSQFEGGSVAYNITNVLRIEGDLDITLLQQSVDLLIQRHESLRTVFKPNESGIICQYILPEEMVKCKIHVHHIPEGNDTQQVINDLINYAFDLEEAPLFRIEIIQIDESSRLLLFNLHHIVGDGWSMEVLSAEVVTWYNSLKQGIGIKLPVLPIQYKDYAYWSKTVLQEASKTYWHQQLSGELPVLEMPIAKPRPKIKTYNGGQVTHAFSTVFTQAIKNKAKEQKATLFMVLMAGVNGLLYRYTGQTDIIMGTPVAGRNHSVLENQIGLYLNTLAIRTRFEQTDTYNELIQKQKSVLLESYAHQDYPFDALVDELRVKRDTSRSALFDIMVVLHNQQDMFKKGASFAGTVATPYPKQSNQASQFDISFSFAEEQDHIRLSVSYNADIYSPEAIQNIITYLEHFILEGIRNPQHSIAKINYLPEEKINQLLSGISIGTVKDKTLPDCIESSFKECPDNTALMYDNKTITYRALDEQSNQLAHYLLSTYTISRGDLVGIKLERTEWLVIAILAVLKTGAAYVPIDVNYPEERISYIENDSACKISITKDLLEDFSQEGSYSTTRPQVNLLPEDLAYVIYTSGSTGRPKGVMLTHANVAAFLHWCKKEFATTDFDILYAATSHCFDLSVYEMFFPLSIGKPLRILHSGLSIAEYIAIDTKILINTVPSVVENLLESGVSLDNVTAINMAGEPVPIALSNTLCTYPIVLRNLYGPSEDTTYSSCYHITGKHHQALPIGKPIDDTHFYIVSEELTLQGEGLIGEICISGKGLSKGYLNNTVLTKEKFIDNPYKAGTMLYRTGDLGYLMPDGNIGFKGRKDLQIKLRGYRIELGEIEYALQEERNINQAVVLIKEMAGEKYIVAYLTGNNIEVELLRSRLSGKLPAYMIPSHYLILDSIPLTPNGKTDRNRLLELEVIKINTTKYIAPTTEVEKQLVVIWEKILGVGKIGITDDFFELGGHSLHITRMLYEINNAFDLKLQMKTIYASQHIQELAQLIEDEIVFINGITINPTAQITNEKNSEIWEI